MSHLTLHFWMKRTVALPDSTFISQREMLRNKYLLELDGNDVASALKISVVFMPKSRFETWALESMLKPYVHYVPVASDLSDTSEQLDWAKAHDAACQNISRRATEFISNFIGYAASSGMSSRPEENLARHRQSKQRCHGSDNGGILSGLVRCTG